MKDLNTIFNEPWILGWPAIIGYLRRYIQLPESNVSAAFKLARWEIRYGFPIYYNPMSKPYLIPSVFMDWWNIAHKNACLYRYAKRSNYVRRSPTKNKNHKRMNRESLQTFLKLL